eukprot:4091185-Karenia_brevis.AAC.1
MCDGGPDAIPGPGGGMGGVVTRSLGGPRPILPATCPSIPENPAHPGPGSAAAAATAAARN